MNPFVFNTTPSVRFGAGAAADLAQLAAARTGTRVLVVTDKGLVKAGVVDHVLSDFTAAAVQHHVFDDVRADPDEAVVLQATEAARAFAATAVIGLGGGSSLDVAKLVAVLAAGGQPLAQMYGINQVRQARLPLTLVPTTAGTGSEVTPIAIITTGQHEKKGVVSPVLLPDVALLDPALTRGLPPGVTAATGVDAMVHAIEAYTSANANNNPISRTLAVQALHLLDGQIRRAVAQGDDMQARSAMLLGSMLAGQAFANSPVAAVHALAYPLGGSYGIPHGLSNALMLPHVLAFNAARHPECYAALARQAFPGLDDGPDEVLAGRLVEYLAKLVREVGLQPRLRDVGIPESACGELAREAMNQTRLLVNNPREITLADAEFLYRSAW